MSKSEKAIAMLASGTPLQRRAQTGKFAYFRSCGSIREVSGAPHRREVRNTWKTWPRSLGAIPSWAKSSGLAARYSEAAGEQRLQDVRVLMKIVGRVLVETLSVAFNCLTDWRRVRSVPPTRHIDPFGSQIELRTDSVPVGAFGAV
jgi:hypothetical protein